MTRLERLAEIRRELPVEHRHAFENFLVGALSTYVTNEEWASCIETAMKAMIDFGYMAKEEKSA